MKKIFSVIILAALACVVLVGCSGGSTVAPAWADTEVLEYSVVNKDTDEKIGTMVVTNTRRPSDTTLGGRSYDSADGKTTIEVRLTDREEVSLVFLTKQYTVLAEEKTYVSADKSYVLNSYHSGKYVYYSYDGGEEKKIKIGNSDYTEGEYLYNFIRSYALPSAYPSSIKIADYATGTVKSVTTAPCTTEYLDVPFPSGSKSAPCTKMEISLSDTPHGKPAYAWFSDDIDGNRVSGVSIIDAKKFPVKIEENDLVYKLTKITVD